jgi:hypothetical protein
MSDVAYASKPCIVCRSAEAIEVPMLHLPAPAGMQATIIMCAPCTRACVNAWARSGAPAWAAAKQAHDKTHRKPR